LKWIVLSHLRGAPLDGFFGGERNAMSCAEASTRGSMSLLTASEAPVV
jgi:hypothetical protein